jgi:hypothetical protein
MNLINLFNEKFRPRYEVSADKYYSEFIKSTDADNLRYFVKEFGSSLSIPSAILAVGSSTFPKSYWKERQKLNKKDPDLKAAESYQDLDLVLVPVANVELVDLEQAVKQELTNKGFEFKAHETTTSGVSYCNAIAFDKDNRARNVICPFLNLDYGLHSISTNLKNGTKLDLILGRDDLLFSTADEKIAEERRDNNAFSLLFRR